MNNYIIYSNEVKKALIENKPIVALESTIITHGMPYPENIKMATNVESLIRNEGAIPATIAVIDGIIHIGLEKDQFNSLATKNNAIKISKRDLSYVISKKKTGGTTVAATMIIAKMAGIKVFATGGIGGVHRGYEHTLDVSADLEELALSDICVVCAGPKAILDLERTLEYLETKGVPVIGYQTKFLPSFYSSTSPFKLNIKLDTAEEIADLIYTQEKLNLNSATLVVNPIPIEFEIPYIQMDEVVNQAVDEAFNKNIKGKDITPFLLDKIKELTKGKSLATNVQLVYNNAILAANIAKEYRKLK